MYTLCPDMIDKFYQWISSSHALKQNVKYYT